MSEVAVTQQLNQDTQNQIQVNINKVEEEDEVTVAEKKYELSINNIKTYYELTIDRASIGQLILSLNFLGIKKKAKQNIYQKKLNKIFFTTKAKEFVEIYNKLLKCESEEERSVKYFNLVGPLPKKLSIPQKLSKTGSPILNIAKIGDRIQALKQRVDFIANRDLPSFYNDKPSHTKHFYEMQELMKSFVDEIDKFEIDFRKAIDICTKLQNAYDIKQSMYE
jgi:hypothetical protein